MSGSADTRKGNCVKKRLSDGTFKEYTYTAKVSKHFHLTVKLKNSCLKGSLRISIHYVG